jgi:hypothetical protein
MCDWIAGDTEVNGELIPNTEEDAVFLVPRRDETFKWYAKRANVSTWKEMPQDAASMVKWYETMNDCYSLNLSDEEKEKISDRIASLLSFVLKTKSRDELIALQEKYGFTYILSQRTLAEQYQLNLPIVHETEFYTLYRADAQTLNPQYSPSAPAPAQNSIPGNIPGNIPAVTSGISLSFEPAPANPVPVMTTPVILGQ